MQIFTKDTYIADLLVDFLIAYIPLKAVVAMVRTIPYNVGDKGLFVDFNCRCIVGFLGLADAGHS